MDAGSYTITVLLNDTANTEWTDGTTAAKEYTFTISAAKLTVTALDKRITAGQSAPDLTTPVLGEDYKVDGLLGQDTLTAVTLTYGETPDTSKAGSYAINISAVQANYDIMTVPGTLTIVLRPSSGGGSSSGSSKTTKTEIKTANGSTDTLKTDADGKTEAEAKISRKAIEDARKVDEAVKVPTEVKAGENSNSAPTVKVELPRGAGKTKIELPVENVNSYTVAVIVHEDGTEDIIKDSIPTEDGVQLTVDGNITVKIIDNPKVFIDTKDHWAKDAIDFVSARELVNGVSSTMYAPDASITRAQLWTFGPPKRCRPHR